MSDAMSDYWLEQRQLEEEELLQRKKAPHSNHYQQVEPEPIIIIESWGLNFCLGNAVKYIARANFKGSKIADLEKAAWYLQREILHEKEKQQKESGS